MPRGAPGGLVAIKKYVYRIVYTYFCLEKNRQVWAACPYILEGPIRNFDVVEEIGDRISLELIEAGTKHADLCIVSYPLLDEIVESLTIRT